MHNKLILKIGTIMSKNQKWKNKTTAPHFRQMRRRWRAFLKANWKTYNKFIRRCEGEVE